MDKHVFIIAGEPSADMHGAALVKALRAAAPQLRISGIGGPLMRSAGADLFADLTHYAVIGFVEVIKHLPVFKKAFAETIAQIKKVRPRAIILIDYPGFNLRLAKKIKQLFPEITIIYYISPQVWAWGEKRIELIKRVVDKMLVVFQFEYELYQRHHISVEFVGHPLLERVGAPENENQVLEQAGLDAFDPLIGILPGSREGEVKRLLPQLLCAASLLRTAMPAAGFVLFKAANIQTALVNKILRNHAGIPLRIINENMHAVLGSCRFAWVCSGTATLETAIREVPMLIVYKTSFLTWLISRILINLPFIGLVNVVAGEKIVPELIQYDVTPGKIVRQTHSFFAQDIASQEQLKKKLRAVRNSLGVPGKASAKAAQAVIQAIKE